MSWTLWQAFGVLVSFGLIAVFCAGEAAFVSVNHLGVRAAAAAGDKRALKLDRMLEHRPRLINDMLVGINVSTVTTSVLVASLTQRLIGTWATTIAAALLVVSILLFAEIMPKAIAYADPIATALRLTPAAAAASRILRPLGWLLGLLPAWLAGRTPEPHSDLSVTEESLTEMVRLGVEQGELSPESSEVVSGILASGDMATGELMVPLSAVISVPASATVSQLADKMIDSGMSRLPVYRTRPDQIVGVVHIKDVFARLYQGKPGTAADMMRPIIRTRQDRTAAELLAEMRSRRQHIAAVVDAAGGTAGVVTIQDLLDEIVGEVVDPPAMALGMGMGGTGG